VKLLFFAPIGKKTLDGVKVNPVLVKLILIFDKKALLSLAVTSMGAEHVPAVITTVWSLLKDIYLLFLTKVRRGAELP
jgi:hypothetical protein